MSAYGLGQIIGIVILLLVAVGVVRELLRKRRDKSER
jgi:hypothetical protein